MIRRFKLLFLWNSGTPSRENALERLKPMSAANQSRAAFRGPWRSSATGFPVRPPKLLQSQSPQLAHACEERASASREGELGCREAGRHRRPAPRAPRQLAPSALKASIIQDLRDHAAFAALSASSAALTDGRAPTRSMYLAIAGQRLRSIAKTLIQSSTVYR